MCVCVDVLAEGQVDLLCAGGERTQYPMLIRDSLGELHHLPTHPHHHHHPPNTSYSFLLALYPSFCHSFLKGSSLLFLLLLPHRVSVSVVSHLSLSPIARLWANNARDERGSEGERSEEEVLGRHSPYSCFEVMDKRAGARLLIDPKRLGGNPEHWSDSCCRESSLGMTWSRTDAF